MTSVTWFIFQSRVRAVAVAVAVVVCDICVWFWCGIARVPMSHQCAAAGCSSDASSVVHNKKGGGDGGGEGEQSSLHFCKQHTAFARAMRNQAQRGGLMHECAKMTNEEKAEYLSLFKLFCEQFLGLRCFQRNPTCLCAVCAVLGTVAPRLCCLALCFFFWSPGSP